MHRARLYTVVATIVIAGTVASAADAATIQRLTYKKAVAYWTAQARAHNMPIRCTGYIRSPTAKYECVFGTVNRVAIVYQPKCELVVGMYEKSHSVRGGNELTGGLGSVRVTLCRPGWQADLPTPWHLPPASG